MSPYSWCNSKYIMWVKLRLTVGRSLSVWCRVSMRPTTRFWSIFLTVTALVALQRHLWRNNEIPPCELLLSCQLYRYKYLQMHPYYNSSHEKVVGIAIVCGLDDRGVAVRVPIGSRILSSPRRPDRLWGATNLLSNEYRGLLPLG
jgi:hypothetical protein